MENKNKSRDRSPAADRDLAIGSDLSKLWTGENLADSEIQLLEQASKERLLSGEQIKKALAEKREEPQLQIIQILFKNQWVNTQDCVRLVTESGKDFAENVGTEADSAKNSDAQVPSTSEKKPRKIKTIGDYLLLKKLGQGGMSIVYKAAHKKTRKAVALKILISGKVASSDEKRRFRKEITAMKRLNHKNIVKIHDIGEARGITYYTMDYIKGQSLKDVGGKISFEKAAEIMKKVCQGMQHAHDANIIHRDLKPENILLDGKGTPYITDFGLAKDISEYSSLTNTGACIGTPLFMSPEQARGKSKDATFSSDVYSLGATFFHLLTGRPPFLKESLVELLNAIVREKPRFPSSLRRGIPPEADWIVLWAMEKDIERRCPSAGTMAADLAACIEGKPLKARPRKISKLPTWMLDKQVMISALVLLFGLCYFLVAFYRVEKPKTKRAAPLSKEQEKNEDNGAKTQETISRPDMVNPQEKKAQKKFDAIKNGNWQGRKSKKIKAYRAFIAKYSGMPIADKAKTCADELQKNLENEARRVADRVIAKSEKALENIGISEAYRQLLDFPEDLENTERGQDILRRQTKMQQRLEVCRNAWIEGKKAFDEGDYQKAKRYYQRLVKVASGAGRKRAKDQLARIQKATTQAHTDERDDNWEKFDELARNFQKLTNVGKMDAAVELCENFIDESEFLMARSDRLRRDLPKMTFAYKALRNILDQGIEIENKRWSVKEFGFDKVMLKSEKGKKLTISLRDLRLRERLDGIALHSRRKFWEGLAIIYFYRHDWENSRHFFRLAQELGARAGIYKILIEKNENKSGQRSWNIEENDEQRFKKMFFRRRFDEILRMQDINGDDRVGWEEWRGSPAKFDLLDTNGDGYLSREDKP